MNGVIFGQDDDDDDDDDHDDDGDGGDDDDNEYGSGCGSGGRVDGDYSRLLPHVWKIIISNQRGTCSLIHFFSFFISTFFRVCTQIEKHFCPSCGNKTLIKVSMSIDEKGVTHYHVPNRKRPFNIRGKRVSLLS